MKCIIHAVLLTVFFTSVALALPIHDLIQSGAVDTVRSMLDEDPALLNAIDEGGYLPIHYACYFNQPEIAELLLALGADLNVESGGGSVPLHGAAYYGHPEMVKWLLDNGADINKQNERGWPPVFSATFSQDRQTLDVLLENGADIRLGDHRNAQLIHYLAWVGDTERALRLIDMGIDINQRHDELDTPIIWAAEAGHYELYDSLNNRGADVSVVNDEGRSLVHYLAFRGQVERMNQLIEGGLNPELPDSAGRTPIYNALWGGDSETILSLIDRGVDINHRANDGDIPIVAAMELDSLSTFEYLLKKGADLHAKVWESQSTPLLVSIFWEQPEKTKLLLDYGADPNARNDEGNTPLMEAANSGKSDIVELLIEAGANPEVIEDHYSHTALHKAAINGDPVSTELLLNAGAKIDQKDREGFTAIDYAVTYCQNSVEKILLDKGAKPSAKQRKTLRIDKQVKEGEMIVWYLGHCSFGIKTANHFLIFDYWKEHSSSADPCVNNGYLTSDQLKGQDVYVFVTHEHRDHYDNRIWDWADQVESIHYVYGFQPERLHRGQPANMFAEYEGPDYTYTAPHTITDLNDLKINTIAANDAGAGFVIEVDGLVLFHAGDHAGWNEGERDGYIAEIDYIAEYTEWVDMAFVNVTGCHTHCEIALKEGLLYALEMLSPKAWSPTHAGGREYRYAEFLEMEDCEKWRKNVACPCHAGDSYFYSNGKIAEAGFSYLK